MNKEYPIATARKKINEETGGLMKNKGFTFIHLTVIIALFCVFSGASLGDDWTAWRGPNGNGISTETGWNPRALITPKIVWKANVAKGHSTVAVKGNYLYTIGNRAIPSGKTTLYEDIVFCIDTRTGKEIWQYAYSCHKGRWPGPRSTPVLDNSRLYTVSQEGHLFCFNALNGQIMWKKNVIVFGLAENSEWGFSYSPVIEGNMLILNAGKSGIALNKKNGKVIWKSVPEKGGLGTPILFNFGEKRLAAIQGDDTIHTVDVKTGEVQWSFKWKSYADPIVFNKNLVYLSASRARTTRGCALLKMTNGEPEVLWHNKKNNTAFQSWVILNGYGYGFKRSNKNHIQCIEIKTGEEKWTKEMEDWGALTAANGKLIILEGDGNLIIAEASPGGYKEISSAKLFKMEDWRAHRDDNINVCWTDPILSNGRIYCRNTYGDLVCVDMK